MNLKYLLDTNALSEPVRPVKNLNFMRQLTRNVGLMCICTPTVAEVRFGLEILPQGRRRAGLEEWYEGMIRTMPVLAFDEVAARIHGRVRAQLRRAGRSAPFADSLVASVALANELTVVTANVRDFAEIPELRIEDWTAG